MMSTWKSVHMASKKQIWFLDVDGVFNILQKHKERDPAFAAFKRTVWPIPMARYLLRAIVDNRYVHPVWLSCWGSSSVMWNEYSLTPHFPVAYHISEKQEKYAKELYPQFAQGRIDGKLVAAQYYLRRFPGRQAVWIEDGFMPETIEWAQQQGHVLIDTTQETIREMLLVEDDLEKAAYRFVDMIMEGRMV